LMVLAIVAGASLSGSDEALAIPCCSNCDDTYNACVAGCGSSSSCLSLCHTRSERCWNNCSFGC
jgi:hypothetical protein